MSQPLFERSKVCGIWNHEFRNRHIVDQIKNAYYNLLSSNYGPKSGLTAIRNSAGRYVYSASSATVLEQLQFFHPVFKFINAVVNTQNKQYAVHGLYVGLLCSGLLYRFLELEENLSYRLIKELSDWVIHTLLLDIQSTSNNKQILLKVDFSNIDHILSIVKSIVNSKVYSILLKEEVDHLCLKIMQCFVKSIPHEHKKDFSHLHISTIEGPPTLNTQIFEGILFNESNFVLHDLQIFVNNLPNTNLKIIIFNIPLSSNTDEKSVVKWLGDGHLEYSYNKYLLLELTKILTENGIHILANQKYIESSIKYDLEKSGFLVLERLGLSLTSSLTMMCKCFPVTSISEINVNKNIGCVSNISVKSIEGKTYLHLSENASQSLTLILTGLNCHILVYLKEAVESCISLLQHSVISNPSVVCGGGCFEAAVAFKLLSIQEQHVLELSKQFDSSPAKIIQVIQAFIDTFLQMAFKPSGGSCRNLIDYCIDSSFNHLWMAEDVEAFWDKDCDSNILSKEKSAKDFTKLKNYDSPYVVEKDEHVTFNNPDFKPSFSSCRRNLTCICNSVELFELPSDVYFTSLSSFKNYFNLRNASSESSFNVAATSEIKFKKGSIVDYWPAKLNALQIAFDGFSELFQTGYCIFDK